MNQGFDFSGIALLIGSITAFLSVIGGFTIQVVLLIRQGARLVEVQKLAVVTHDLVNSKSEEQARLIKELAYAAGLKAGTDAERANPMVPASTT